MERLIELIAESDSDPLDEMKSQNPFKNKRIRGPAVDRGWMKKGHPFFGYQKRTSDTRSERWDCGCSNYACTCTDKLTKRTIGFGVNKAWKKEYNKRYRAWVAGQAKRFAKAKAYRASQKAAAA